MPDKRIDQLPDVSTLPQDGSQRLMLFGNYLTGKLYKGTLSIEENWKALFSAAFSSPQVAASTTTYGQLNGNVTFQTEANKIFVIPEDCTIKNLFIRTTGTQPASGSLTIALRKNFVNTVLSVTIPAGGASAQYSNITDSFDVVAGDVLTMQFVNAATDLSISIQSTGLTAIKTG